MKSPALLLALFPLIVATAGAQLVVEDARALVGQEARIGLRLETPSDSTRTLVGTIRLGNPTVFFPERFVGAGNDSVLSYAVTAMNDSTWTFAVTYLRRLPSSTLPTIWLTGEALAGSDSVCTITFDDLRLDGSTLPPARGTLVTASIGPRLPYVRFATLEPNYPDPVRRGAETTWGFRIDKPSDVRLIIYNLIGQELEIFDLGLVGIGPHTFRYTPGPTMPSGVYWLRLLTNTGLSDDPFLIIQ